MQHMHTALDEYIIKYIIYMLARYLPRMWVEEIELPANRNTGKDAEGKKKKKLKHICWKKWKLVIGISGSRRFMAVAECSV